MFRRGALISRFCRSCRATPAAHETYVNLAGHLHSANELQLTAALSLISPERLQERQYIAEIFGIENVGCGCPSVRRGIQCDRHACTAKERDVRTRVANRRDLAHRKPVLCTPVLNEPHLVVLIEVAADCA
jgi:hypothetical protein